MIIGTEAKPELTTRVLRTIAEIRSIAPDWRELFQRSRATAFQSPDWLLPWIEVFTPEKIVFIEARRNGHLVAVSPCLIYLRNGDRALAFMGGGVSDYLDFLIDPLNETESLNAILRALIDAREDWSILDLTDLPDHSSLLKYAPFHNLSCEHDVCSVLSLPSSKDELLHLFSKRQRANLRNAGSRLRSAGHGQIELATAENLSDFLNDLFTLHTNRWSEKGEAGVLADHKVREFHLRCTPELLKNGALHLLRLRLTDRTLAVIYSLFSANTAFCYLQGFDPESAWLSPGTQLMLAAISRAVDRGLKEFDFLRGDERYKQHWRPQRKPTYRIQVARSELRALLDIRRPTHSRAA